MKAVFTLRNTLLGLASWAIPFFAAFAFYNSAGNLNVALITFKTVMILVGGVAGAWLLVIAFRRLTPTLATGIALGLYWLAINWALDLVLLVGLMGQEPVSWLLGIGLRYFMLPIMAGAMGKVAAPAT